MNIHPTSDISLRMGRLILEQKQINGQLTSMQNITYDRCPYQAVGRFYPPLGGASRAFGLPRAAANAVSGQKPGPTLRPGAEDREKKSGSVDHRDCDAVDKEKSPCVKWSENKYDVLLMDASGTPFPISDSMELALPPYTVTASSKSTECIRITFEKTK